MIDLDDLDRLVGQYVRVERARTLLERIAYAYGDESDAQPAPTEGFSGVVESVGPMTMRALEHDGWREELTGRMVAVDYGMEFLVTADCALIWRAEEPQTSGRGQNVGAGE